MVGYLMAKDCISHDEILQDARVYLDKWETPVRLLARRTTGVSSLPGRNDPKTNEKRAPARGANRAHYLMTTE